MEKNYKEDFRQYVFARISEYRDYGCDVSDTTPQKYNAYVNIRSVLAIRFSPERVFVPGGNQKMDYETFARCCKALDDILPPKEEREESETSLFESFLKKLPQSPQDARERGSVNFVWSDGDRILCDTRRDLEFILDLLKSAGEDETYYLGTGYYDPAEDESLGVIDEYTGCYYITRRGRR